MVQDWKSIDIDHNNDSDVNIKIQKANQIISNVCSKSFFFSFLYFLIFSFFLFFLFFLIIQFILPSGLCQVNLKDEAREKIMQALNDGAGIHE